MPLSVSFLETQGSFLKTQKFEGGSVISFQMPLSVCLETQGSFLKTQELGWSGGGGGVSHLLPDALVCLIS